MEQPNVVSWNALMAAYAHNGHHVHARAVFDRMELRNAVSWTCLMTGYHKAACMEVAEWIFSRMPSWGVRDLVSCNAMIQAYALNGHAASARRIFDAMQRRDAATWTGMIAAYTDAGLCASADAVLRSMSLEGDAEPDGATFSCVLAGLSQRGMVEAARQCFRSMVSNYCIQASIQHYCCMVDALGRSRQLRQAEELVEDLVRGCAAGDDDDMGIAWTALLAACKLHGEPEIAARAAHRGGAFAAGATGYVLLSTTFCSSQAT
ncbi:hypothetical protein SELMODRAFT_91339 [Selaginella moellendorffii]|uniref:Pentacotripeptide-repeat region of PRORP domain-containing protein n=1 Tax=Selaginella moellendorffii TaxID=88036 RepID=D8REC0_SELML|nr:hypothetical protein SELMODRAFT_91339 [Selaginella moellendorffii]